MNILVVGLGNVGKEYENTRHNIGFESLNFFASNNNIQFSLKKLGYLGVFRTKGRKIILLKPTTFMNLSGKSVLFWMKKLKLSTDQILIITDDINLPLGTLRLKSKGSHGGHNGLLNIQEMLSTDHYPRLRLGIGKEFAKGKQSEYVLSQWDKEEIICLNTIFERVNDAINLFLISGIEHTMNKINGRAF